MNILLIEPYYTGSHKMWADGYQKHSRHEIELMTMEGRHWKWRMHGGAIEAASRVNSECSAGCHYDLILVTDMIDVSTFKALLAPSMRHIPIVLYFHENQLSYPYSEQDTDTRRSRDFHYGFINYTSALAADYVYFNSASQMDAFYGALETLLGRMPDYRNLDTLDTLKAKTSILPLGIDFSPADTAILDSSSSATERTLGAPPLILWTHRWEYDKNPDDFFNALIQISRDGYDYQLAVLGAGGKAPPEIFETAKQALKKHIITWGRPDTYDEYVGWLLKGDLLPVTALHETFGISLMEALYCGVTPMLPKRLSYPELVCPQSYPDLFYRDSTELASAIKNRLDNIETVRAQSFKAIASRYDWNQMASVYDHALESVLEI